MKFTFFSPPDSDTALTPNWLHNYLMKKLSSHGYQLVRMICLQTSHLETESSVYYPEIAVFYEPQNQKYIWLAKPSSFYHDRHFLAPANQRGNSSIKHVSTLLEALNLIDTHPDDRYRIPRDRIFFPLCHELRGHFILYLADENNKTLTFFEPKRLFSLAYQFADVISANAIRQFYDARGYTHKHDISGQQPLLDGASCGYHVIDKILSSLGMGMGIPETVSDVNKNSSPEKWACEDKIRCIVVTFPGLIKLGLTDNMRLLFQWLSNEKELPASMSDAEISMSIDALLLNHKDTCMLSIERTLLLYKAELRIVSEGESTAISMAIKEIKRVFHKTFSNHQKKSDYDTLFVDYHYVNQEIDTIFKLRETLEAETVAALNTISDQQRQKYFPFNAFYKLISELWLTLANALYFQANAKNLLKKHSLKMVRDYLLDQKSLLPHFFKYIAQSFEKFTPWLSKDPRTIFYEISYSQFLCQCITLHEEMSAAFMPEIDKIAHETPNLLNVSDSSSPLITPTPVLIKTLLETPVDDDYLYLSPAP